MSLLPTWSVGNAGVSWFKGRGLDSPVAQFLWTTSQYREKIWSEDRNTPFENIHAQWIPSSICSDYVQRLAKTVEPDTESQDCDFESKTSQTSLAQINTEGQLWRRDSNAALPKRTPTECHQIVAASKQPGWIGRMNIGLLIPGPSLRAQRWAFSRTQTNYKKFLIWRNSRRFPKKATPTEHHQFFAASI